MCETLEIYDCKNCSKYMNQCEGKLEDEIV